MVKEWGGGEMAGKGSHTHCGFFFFLPKDQYILVLRLDIFILN